jgi:thiamine pyrophosphokinase
LNDLDQLWLAPPKSGEECGGGLASCLQTCLVFEQPKKDKKEKRGFIFTAGQYKSEDVIFYSRIKLHEEDLVICADGGYDTVKLMGLTPHVVIGDMDSVKSEVPATVNKRIYPENKDKTDLGLCIDYALQAGCTQIFLLGAFGGRIDHSIGALFSMRYIVEQGAECMLLTSQSRVYLIKDRVVVPKNGAAKLSLIPLTDTVEGVTTKNLWYPLENATLKQESSLGISNEFAAETAEITLTKGLLFVICEQE